MTDLIVPPLDGNGIIWVHELPENPDRTKVYMLWDGVDASKAVRYEFSGGELQSDGVVETTISNLVDSAISGEKRKITDIGQGVIVESDGVSFRGAERFVSGLSVNRQGELLLNGQYCRELGVNAFSLIWDLASGLLPNNYKTVLDQCSDMGVRIVRVSMTPPASAADYLSLLHSGTIKIPAKWSDFNATWTSAIDTVMDYAASKCIYIVASLVWGPKYIVDAFGETYATAFSTANSKTRSYIRALTRLFVSKYKDHPAIGAWSHGNEWPLRGEYSVVYTDTRKVLTETAAIMKMIDPARAILSCNLDVIYDGTLTRPSFSTQVALAIANNPDPIDCVDFHAYSDRAWLSEDPANSLNSLTIGAYDYAEEWISRFIAESKAVGKAFTLTEAGILGRALAGDSTGQELYGDTTKFSSLLEKLYQSGIQLALLWNLGNTSISPQPQWDFVKGTTRGDAYQPLIKQYTTKFRVGAAKKDGSQYFNPSSKFNKPAGAATFTGVSSVGVYYNGGDFFAGKQGTILTHIMIAATQTSGARPISAQKGGYAGWNIEFAADGLTPYFTIRDSSSGVAIDTSTITPPLALNTWSQRGFTWNGTDRVKVYVDGFWFDKKSSAYTYAGKTSDTASQLALGTGMSTSNPFAGSLAMVLYCNRVMNTEEIADFYNYGTIPSDAILFPLAFDGKSIGAQELTPATINAAVTFGATSLAY